MLACLPHHGENLLDELDRYILMEEITHRIDKDGARLLPAQRNHQRILMKSKFETIGVIRLAHQFQPAREPLSIAVLAARADLVATGERVPGRLGPLDA